MDPSSPLHARLPVRPDEIARYCRKWHVRELAVFGSVLRSDFGPGSDVDVLVTLGDDASRSLEALVAMEDELSALFGRRIDLVTRDSIARSVNWYRRGIIFESAEVLYAA